MKSRSVMCLALLLTACGSESIEQDDTGNPGASSGWGAAPLPAWRTPQERISQDDPMMRQDLRLANPPTGTVVTPAEWAPSEGVIVNVPLYEDTIDFYGNMIAGIVKSGAVPYILVDSANTANTVTQAALTPYGTSRSTVRFITMRTDAFWTRDYGPWHVYVDGRREIVDMVYYPNRRNDDAVPARFGDIWGEDVFAAALYTEGGNFMTDGLGTCWVSQGVLWNNALSESNVKSIYRSYLGCRTLTFVEPIPDEGTTHIDMFSKVMNEDTIIVAYSSTSLGATQGEAAALERAARTYENSPKPGGGRWNIVRIPMSFGSEGTYWDSSRVYFAHTNSLIVNDTVLVPTYGLSTDAEALRVYRQVLPGYQVIGVPSRSVIPMGGSVHCTTMQVPEKLPADTHARCGDGTIDAGEQCDANNLGTDTCKTLGYGAGTLRCTSTCTFDTSACTRSTSSPRCGNGVVEASELCDRSVKSCTSVDSTYTSGQATCRSDCSSWDTSSCVSAAPRQPVKASHSDTIQSGQWHNFAPITASAGAFIATLSVDADADLYVKKGSQPTVDSYDCRPYYEGAATEKCELLGPGPFYISINGYDAITNYNLVVDYYPN